MKPGYVTVMLGACLQFVNRALCHLLMRIEVRGRDNLGKAGPRVLIVPNHVGLLDPPLLATVLGAVTFAIDRTVADVGWVKVARRISAAARATSLVIDPEQPLAARELIAALKRGEQVVVFPEGRLTVTGAMMKVYDGAAFIAERADAVLLPVHIGGMESSFFTRLPRQLARRRLRPRITVTIGEPIRPSAFDLPKGRTRREAATARLREALVGHAMRATMAPGTVPEALVAAARAHGTRRRAVEELLFRRTTYRRLIAAMQARGERLGLLTPSGARVAVMLPVGADSIAAVLGLMAGGRVPCLVDWRAGGEFRAYLEASRCRVLLTSRAHVERERIEGLAGFAPDIHVVFLEDIGPGGGAAATSKSRSARADQTALLLPGSDGIAVAFTHRQLLAQVAQIRTVVDIGRTDKVFAFLPLSHPLGFAVSVLLPLMTGGLAYLHDWPRTPRLLAEYIYLAKPSVLFAPVAMLAEIGRVAKAEDLHSLRYLFAVDGPADRGLRDLFIDRFGLRILDILATPETLIAAMNTPAAARTGTLGALVPGITVEGEADALLLNGPNFYGAQAFAGRMEDGFLLASPAAARPTLKLVGGGDQAA